MSIRLDVVAGDILEFDADVVAFKYAQGFHGADRAASQALEKHGLARERLMPAVGEVVLVPTAGGMVAPFALFIGVPDLYRLRYSNVRAMASTALRTLARRMPAAEHLAMTIHGPGFGLDEVESFLSQLAGYVDAFQLGDSPRGLRRISIVDRRPARVDEIKEAFTAHADEIPGAAVVAGGAMTIGIGLEADASARVSTPDRDLVDRASDDKPHLFVALPFDPTMNDLFRYGIQQPARAAGFLCEHLGEEAFTGDVLERIKDRIQTSSAVIGVLTGDNPNVFLEVGYSWGVGRPTILVSMVERPSPFDVQGQKQIRYKDITDLETQLTRELNELRRHLS